MGEHIILAGRRWKIDEIDGEAKTVFVSPARGGKAPEFVSVGGELHTRVLREMRAALTEEGEPPWLNDNAKCLLRAARATAQKCGILPSGVIVMPHRVQWFPWVGSRGFLTLKAYASALAIEHEVDKLSISYDVESPAGFLDHLKCIVDSSVQARELARFIPVRAIQKYDELLPEDLLDEANGHDYLDLIEAKMSAKRVLDTWR